MARRASRSTRHCARALARFDEPDPARCILDLPDRQLARAAEEVVQKPDRLVPCAVKAAALAGEEVARAHRIVLCFKRNAGGGPALLELMWGDAESQGRGIRRELVLHLQQEPPRRVGRVDLDDEGGSHAGKGSRTEARELAARTLPPRRPANRHD